MDPARNALANLAGFEKSLSTPLNVFKICCPESSIDPTLPAVVLTVFKNFVNDI
jgi:hypothetical protein